MSFCTIYNLNAAKYFLKAPFTVRADGLLHGIVASGTSIWRSGGEVLSDLAYACARFLR